VRALVRGPARIEIAVDGRTLTVRRFVAGKLVDESVQTASSPLKAKWDADHVYQRELAAGFTRDGDDDDIVALGQAELLAAIEANPADLDTRLVLADWLTERGDPWGQLIATQYAIEHLPRVKTTARRDELDRQELTLRFKHAARLWGELGEMIINDETQTYASDLVRATWESGFIHEATIDQAEPRTFPRLVRALATLDIARLLQMLYLISSDWGHMLGTLGTYRWPRLRALTITQSSGRVDASRVVPALAGMPALEHLAVMDTSNTDALVHALASTPCAPNLRVLVMGRVQLTGAGVAALAATPLPQLESLRITGEGPPNAAAVLAKKATQVMIDLRGARDDDDD
jgi:uncharacterized protein (TIGR02996 family)